MLHSHSYTGRIRMQVQPVKVFQKTTVTFESLVWEKFVGERNGDDLLDWWLGTM